MNPLDFIHNGAASGSVAERLLACNLDPNGLRPYIGNDGRSYITSNVNGKPQAIVTNTPATLTKEQWIELDQVVTRVARPLLKVWGGINEAGLTYRTGGLGTTVLQRQTVTDAGEAGLSMDGLKRTNRDRGIVDLVGLPLPIVHSEFSFPLRELIASRQNRGPNLGPAFPFDTYMLEQATRRCAEVTEKLTIGTLPLYTFQSGSVYGLTNYPQRITKTITLPTAANWTPQLHLSEILGMIQSMNDIFYYGPYNGYYSPGWTKYLDDDYSAAYPGISLRMRLSQIKDLMMYEKADYLPNFQVVLYERSTLCMRAVTGMDLMSVQWESEGGLEINFKVMGIMIPQPWSDANGSTGICHATAA